MMSRSIRRRLFAALAGLTVLICVCYTALALVIAYVTEDMLIDRLLEREASAIATQYKQHRQIGQAANGLVAVYGAFDALPSPVRERVEAGDKRAEIFTRTGQHYHLRVLQLSPTRQVWLLADVAPLLVVSKVIKDVGGVLLFVALGLIGLALLLAWLLSRKIVRPLQVLAAEVRDVKGGEAIVLSAAGRSDEIGYLADRLGAAITELQAALAREHDFTRDVSHELRTPLTVMRNALGNSSLCADGVAQLRAGVADMGAAIDVLFALARAEHVETSVFDLRGAVEESLLRLVDAGDKAAERADHWLTLDLPERMLVCGNTHLTTLLLNNCLGNALFHGGPQCRLHIAMAGQVLQVKNTIAAGSQAIPQGFLHGQNLLKRMAGAMGWRIAFEGDAACYTVEIVAVGALSEECGAFTVSC